MAIVHRRLDELVIFLAGYIEATDQQRAGLGRIRQARRAIAGNVMVIALALELEIAARRFEPLRPARSHVATDLQE